MWDRSWAFIRLSRPHFLVGGFLMFGLGAATAGSIGVADYVSGQILVTSTQLTAHYVNEYADVEADRHVQHRTFFSGGSGVLANEVLSARTALYASLGLDDGRHRRGSVLRRSEPMGDRGRVRGAGRIVGLLDATDSTPRSGLGRTRHVARRRWCRSVDRSGLDRRRDRRGRDRYR
jgi:hypothetical protein